MSEQLNALTFSFSVQAVDGEVLTSPTYRLTINVRFGDSVGLLQLGYYVCVNDSVILSLNKLLTLRLSMKRNECLLSYKKAKNHLQ